MEKVLKGLYEATVAGSVTSLLSLLQKDALILERCMVTSFGETPLHIAAMLGHVEFCSELLRLKPELAAEFDSRRSSAPHLASAKGYIDIVKALLSVKPEMCFACDRDGNNPLHVATMKGKVSVLKELVKAQPDAARARVDRGETILHLCVQHYQVEALKLLVEDLNDEELLNARDDEGNTILHLAVADKQIEFIRYLLVSTSIDVNAQNSYELTTLDILAKSRRDAKDFDIADCIQQVEAQKSKEIASPRPNVGNHIARSLTSSTSKNRNRIKAKKIKHATSTLDSRGRYSWKHYFDKQDVWLNKQRDALMVVASLIATMAFQAGVSPPAGVWQDDSGEHSAGYSILAYRSPALHKKFVAFNTLSFISSISIILLISGLPFKRKVFMWILMLILWISLSSTAKTCVISITVSTPPHEKGSRAAVFRNTILVWICLMALLVLVHTVASYSWLVRKLRDP